ncbi:SAM and SH3 domain-containing protein 1, partial [Trachymyrmex cornetzi]
LQVDTPDSVLQSGLGLGPDMGHTILRSMVDPRDYDRLRYLQMNGGQPNSFEETIHRLKVQEALRKKERFHKEHEEILRDIRQGLMQLGRDGRGQLPGDDTYMYDEDARCGGAGSLGPGPGGHWYDEPPYESDPEDFLMGASGGPVPTATIQNGRVCFTLNMRPENRSEGVISLRTAGDISLPRDRSRKGATSTMRGLIVPQGHNNPPTIIPLTHSRASRESGDYASSDVQSVSSRLSTVSVDTSRSDQPSVGGRHPDRPEHHHEHRHNHRHHHEHHHSVSPRSNQRHPAASTTVTNTVTDATSPQSNAQRRPSRSSGEEGLSPSQSSDYEDQEELESQHSAAVHTSEASALLEGDARAGIAGRARNLRHDVQRKISRLRQDRASSEAFPCSASSVESLPSGSGSSTQALVRAGSNHSSISCEDRDAVSPTSIGPVLCRARALVDYTPSPYDKDALKFKGFPYECLRGNVVSEGGRNRCGTDEQERTMEGRCTQQDRPLQVHKRRDTERQGAQAGGAGALAIRRQIRLDRDSLSRGVSRRVSRVEDGGSVSKMNVTLAQEHIPVFVLNGYEDLELFRELEAADLDYLRIHQPEHRAKILTAVQLLHDLQSGSEGDLASSSEGDEVSRLVLTSGQTSGHCSPFNRRQFPRDSGCYDAHKNTTSRRTISPESTTTSSKLPRENNLDNATAMTKNTSSAGGTDGSLTDAKDDFHPNIPISSSVAGQKESQFDKSPLLRGGNVRYIAKRGNFGETVVIEDACEGSQKLGGIVKYIGGTSDLGLENTGNVTGLSQRGCLSEKSSDSGVSSSSISSAPPPRDKVLATASAASDSPTKTFGSFSRASPTSQGGKSQNNDGSYQ